MSSINLQQLLTTGETNYISKHNSNYSEIEASFNLHDADLEAIKAAMSAGADLDFRLNAFNLAINGGFDYWQRGIATRPDCWEIENNGGSFAVSRSTTQLYLNTYSVYTQNQGQLTQLLAPELAAALSSTFSISFGAWIYTNTIDNARVGIYDGITTQWSEYHEGDGAWRFYYKSYVQSSGSSPSEIKLIMDSAGNDVYWNAAVCMRGNPNAGPKFVANCPVLEEMRVFSLIESGKAAVAGVGYLNAGDRELTTRVRFMAPKRATPTIIIEDEETGYEITYTNANRHGFDLTVAEIGGASGANGFEYTDIDWRAEV